MSQQSELLQAQATTSSLEGPRKHSEYRVLQITRWPATKLQAGAGLLTFPIEAVVRDANVNKTLKDLRMNNPELEHREVSLPPAFYSSGAAQGRELRMFLHCLWLAL